jgi:DNA-binding NarL/FixJ family response regulator
VLLRAGLARLLDDGGIAVVAQAGHGDELARKVQAHRPDVAVVSLSPFPGREELDGVGVLMLSQCLDELCAVKLLREGTQGVGFLLEHRVPDVERFRGAVREVARGGSVLDPAVVARVVDRRAGRDALSPREREVFELMAQGRSNRAIARTAYLSERAVERHITAIFDKLRLPASRGTHRRVLAALAHHRAGC